LGLISANVSIS